MAIVAGVDFGTLSGFHPSPSKAIFSPLSFAAMVVGIHWPPSKRSASPASLMAMSLT